MYTDCCDGTIVSRYVVEQTPYLINVDLSQFYQNITFTYQISNCPTPTPTPTITSTPAITPTSTVTPSPSYIPKKLTMKFNSTGNTNNWFIEGSTVFDMIVDWGDTQVEGYVASDMYNPIHTYSASGEYTCVVIFTDPTIIVSLDVSIGYGDNRLVDIIGLEYLTTLSYLNLSGNLLTSFDPNPLVDSVSTLDLSYNDLTTFTSTEPLPYGLANLYLNDNSITTFTPVEPLPINLQNIFLNNNLLTNFNPSYPMINVVNLVLNNNLIENFSPSQPLPISLEVLNLSNNLITNFLPATPFAISVSELYLNDNSLSSSGINDVLVYLSGVTGWLSPNNITLFNQTGGGCLNNPGVGYNAYISLTGLGWTIDVDMC